MRAPTSSSSPFFAVWVEDRPGARRVHRRPCPRRACRPRTSRRTCTWEPWTDRVLQRGVRQGQTRVAVRGGPEGGVVASLHLDVFGTTSKSTLAGRGQAGLRRGGRGGGAQARWSRRCRTRDRRATTSPTSSSTTAGVWLSLYLAKPRWDPAPVRTITTTARRTEFHRHLHAIGGATASCGGTCDRFPGGLLAMAGCDPQPGGVPSCGRRARSRSR